MSMRPSMSCFYPVRSMGLMARPLAVALVALVALVAFASCGSEDAATPAPCLDGPGRFLAALEAAPDGEILVGGRAKIGDCLIDGQPGAELSEVARGLVRAATELNRAAQDDPGGRATAQLGYLVGAVQDKAATTGGIHRDLVLRLDSAARFSPGDAGLPVEFERAFGRGYAAAQ